MTRLLVWLQWRQLRHVRLGFRRVAVGIVIALVGIAGLGLLAAAAIAFARSASVTALGALASIAFPLLVVMLLLLGIPRIFHLLYSARDIELLFTLPLPARSVFLVKYGQSVLSIGAIGLLLAFVPLLSYGVAADAAWLYYPVFSVAIVSLVAGALGLCHLLDLLLVRILPPRRVRGFMTALSALAGLLGALSGQIIGLAGGNVSSGGIEALPMLPTWLPTTWGATALVRAYRGEASSLLYVGGLATLAVGLIAASTTLVERGFRLGWVRLSEGDGGRARARPRPRTARSLSRPSVAIALKELRLLRRDAREWMTFVPLLVVFGFALYRTMSAGRSAGHAVDDARRAWLLIQAELLGAFAFVGANFAAPAVAREGTGVWVVRSAPLSGWQVILGKFWVYWLVPLGGMLLVEIGLGLFFGWLWHWVIVGSAALASLSAGSIGLGLWIGTLGGKHNPDRPTERIRLGATILLIVLNVLYLLLGALPAGLALALADRWLANVLSVLWVTLVGLSVAAFTLRLAAGRVNAGVQIEMLEQR